MNANHKQYSDTYIESDSDSSGDLESTALIKNKKMDGHISVENSSSGNTNADANANRRRIKDNGESSARNYGVS